MSLQKKTWIMAFDRGVEWAHRRFGRETNATMPIRNLKLGWMTKRGTPGLQIDFGGAGSLEIRSEDGQILTPTGIDSEDGVLIVTVAFEGNTT